MTSKRKEAGRRPCRALAISESGTESGAIRFAAGPERLREREAATRGQNKMAEERLEFRGGRVLPHGGPVKTTRACADRQRGYQRRVARSNEEVLKECEKVCRRPEERRGPSHARGRREVRARAGERVEGGQDGRDSRAFLRAARGGDVTVGPDQGHGTAGVAELQAVWRRLGRIGRLFGLALVGFSRLGGGVLSAARATMFRSRLAVFAPAAARLGGGVLRRRLRPVDPAAALGPRKAGEERRHHRQPHAPRLGGLSHASHIPLLLLLPDSGQAHPVFEARSPISLGHLSFPSRAIASKSIKP
jgi:hypothetical protein